MFPNHTAFFIAPLILANCVQHSFVTRDYQETHPVYRTSILVSIIAVKNSSLSLMFYLFPMTTFSSLANLLVPGIWKRDGNTWGKFKELVSI